MSCPVEETSKDFSRFITTDLNGRLQPLNKLIDDMHIRLEEFQTMVSFARQERINAINLLASVESNNEDLNILFKKIDSVETLIEHVKTTLNGLEQDIEKAEEEIGYNDSKTTKVASIFTPLFKKATERSQSPISPQVYRTSDYFDPSPEFDSP